MREAFDWAGAEAKDRAVLCFVVRGGEILLIRKKRGLGAGKVNGPGGRIEVGETAWEAAVREVQEEVCVTPLNLSLRGELFFRFADGYSIHCGVFFSDGCEGEVKETGEAMPMWVSLAGIPYEEMWEDDRLWLPAALEGKRFAAYFEFAGEKMMHEEFRWEPEQFFIA